MGNGENATMSPEKNEQEQQEYLRGLLLQAASEGKTVRRPLMIGNTEVRDGVTFESARYELYRLMDQGLVRLDNQYRPYLTDEGIKALAG